MAKDNKAGAITAFLVGIGIGAVATLFLAPQAGEEIRSNVTKAVDDSVGQLRERTKEVTQRSQKMAEAVKDQVQDAVGLGADAFKQAKKARA